jgi:hypothetical protein
MRAGCPRVLCRRCLSFRGGGRDVAGHRSCHPVACPSGCPRGQLGWPVAVNAAQAAERDPGPCRPHPLRLDRGDREGARRPAFGLVPALRAGREGAVEPGLLLVRSQLGQAATPVTACQMAVMSPSMTISSPNEYITVSLSDVCCRDNSQEP